MVDDVSELALKRAWCAYELIQHAKISSANGDSSDPRVFIRYGSAAVLVQPPMHAQWRNAQHGASMAVGAGKERRESVTQWSQFPGRRATQDHEAVDAAARRSSVTQETAESRNSQSDHHSSLGGIMLLDPARSLQPRQSFSSVAGADRSVYGGNAMYDRGDRSVYGGDRAAAMASAGLAALRRPSMMGGTGPSHGSGGGLNPGLAPPRASMAGNASFAMAAAKFARGVEAAHAVVVDMNTVPARSAAFSSPPQNFIALRGACTLAIIYLFCFYFVRWGGCCCSSS